MLIFLAMPLLAFALNHSCRQKTVQWNCVLHSLKLIFFTESEEFAQRLASRKRSSYPVNYRNNKRLKVGSTVYEYVDLTTYPEDTDSSNTMASSSNAVVLKEDDVNIGAPAEKVPRIRALKSGPSNDSGQEKENIDSKSTQSRIQMVLVVLLNFIQLLAIHHHHKTM